MQNRNHQKSNIKHWRQIYINENNRKFQATSSQRNLLIKVNRYKKQLKTSDQCHGLKSIGKLDAKQAQTTTSHVSSTRQNITSFSLRSARQSNFQLPNKIEERSTSEVAQPTCSTRRQKLRCSKSKSLTRTTSRWRSGNSKSCRRCSP